MSATKPPPPDWEGEENKRWRTNAADVPRKVREEDAGTMQRIKTYCNRFGYNFNQVVKKIFQDGMFAAHFTKTPSKQGMHEIIAADYLRALPGVGGFEVLPKGGAGAMHISADGEFCTGKSKSARDSKTLDFRWTTSGVQCWASHKYTKEQGGAQDHQFNDQKRFVENFRNHKGEQVAFFAICDGAYYTAKKMSELQRIVHDTPLCFAVHLEDVAEKLRGI